MSTEPLQPPVPFADFEFSFDPSLSNLFPNPPPLPSSADLFSPAETTDLLGFLDNFGELNHWEFNSTGNDFITQDSLPSLSYDYTTPTSLAPYSNPHLNTAPDPSTSNRQRPNTRSGSSRGNLHTSKLPDDSNTHFEQQRPASQARSTTSDSPPSSFTNAGSEPRRSTSAAPRSKPLLSTPQKRLNHIMSEQKRRNAIRDGYAQLIALLAPAGSAPGLGMPTRGRPKGSGSRGKGQSKGKSGVLFRAVEYCRWLEEGRDALRDEVLRLETTAGIRHS